MYGSRESIDRARRLLDELEMLWRGRIERIDAVLANDEPGRNDR